VISFLIAKFKPVIPKQLNRMLRAVRTIAATHVISRAVLIATPANPLRVCGMYWKFFSHPDLWSRQIDWLVCR